MNLKKVYAALSAITNLEPTPGQKEKRSERERLAKAIRLSQDLLVVVHEAIRKEDFKRAVFAGREEGYYIETFDDGDGEWYASYLNFIEDDNYYKHYLPDKNGGRHLTNQEKMLLLEPLTKEYCERTLERCGKYHKDYNPDEYRITRYPVGVGVSQEELDRTREQQEKKGKE